jgi:hypothetical protein
MKSVLKQFAVVPGLILFWLAALPNAYAEPTKVDQNIGRLMRDDPTLGVVFMEARLSEQGETHQKHCQSIRMKLLSDAGVTTTVITQVSRMRFGKLSENTSYGGSTTLVPGAYAVQSVECESATGIRLQGPFARFTVRAGQILNLGCLTINYKLGPPTLFTRSENKGDWKAVDLSPKAVAWINKAAPMAFAKAKSSS